MRFRRRLLLLYVIFCAAMGIVWLRSAQMLLVDGAEWADRARTLRQRTERLDALRGPVVSSDGVILAEDVAVYQLAVIGWQWTHRGRARCTGCGLVHFAGASGRLPRRCACFSRWKRGGGTRRSDAYPRAGEVPEGPHLERLPDGSLDELEDMLEMKRGGLAKQADARVLEIDKIVAEYEQALRRGGEGDFLLDDKVALRRSDLMMRPFVLQTDVPLEAVRLVQTDEVGRYRGFRIQTTLRRRYPLGDFAPQLLGFTSVIHSEEEYRTLHERYGRQITHSTRVGRAGIERAYNWALHGQTGYRQMELEPRGSFTKVIEDHPPVPGRPLRLTLSARVSRDGELLLEKRATPQGYLPGGRPSAAFVATDAHTGEVLIWCEAPRFDLNEELDTIYDPVRNQAKADTLAKVWLPRRPLSPGLTYEQWRKELVRPVPISMSRVAQVAVEPGSTMKTMMALAMLECGKPLAYEGMVCRSDGKKPGCHNCGRVGLELAIARSCNRFFAWSLRDAPAWRSYRTYVADFVRRMGLGERPGPAMPEWSRGQWLWDWHDFPLARAVTIAQKRLDKDLGARAPVLRMRIDPRAPGTVGGDPERLAGTLAKAAAHVAKVSGAREVALYVTRESREGRQVRVRFGLRAAARPGWHALPGPPAGPAALPPVLRGRSAHRAGVEGNLARGGTAWFTARFERRMGRTHEDQPVVIRPDDGRNVAIGQGPVLATPLQMARAMGVIANGGTLVPLHLVQTPGIAAKRRSLGVSPTSLRRVRKGMHDVVNSSFGTARRADWASVPATVYGKTGTSQVGATWKPWAGDEEGAPWHHWFVGFAEAPGRRTMAFACVLHARTEAAAGLTAAKATADILSRWYEAPESYKGSE